ncbi:MipA/OmpV family protein [Rhizobium sp. TH2]|uniref:MipA/OmpV family protein n=1 Tax=Rhizobium sp. TH2 TaxID=2775403 RepID=UPI0035BE3BCA
MRTASVSALSAALVLLGSTAMAQEAWWSGDWYVKLGGAGFVAPRFQGDNSYILQGKPLISVGKGDEDVRFISRNDNTSFSLYDNRMIRLGVTGKILLPRDGDTSNDLKGLKPVEWGGELGGFAEVYPTDWMRFRTEIRQGIRSHDGVVGDLAADAFYDVTPTVRVSAGPRLSFATEGYMDAYYGVNAKESAKSGLSKYNPDGGLQSTGIGGAVNWKATEQLETSLFAEYTRLLGPVADSSLVKERGSRDQFMIGVSATYKFNFKIP